MVMKLHSKFFSGHSETVRWEDFLKSVEMRWNDPIVVNHLNACCKFQVKRSQIDKNQLVDQKQVESGKEMQSQKHHERKL